MRKAGRAGGFRIDLQARLNDAVAVHQGIGLFIDHRTTERMSQRADHAARSTGRHARIGIERDHIAHAVECVCIAEYGVVAGVFFTGQQLVEFHQLAALAFPAHPAVFFLVPLTPAIQKQKLSLMCTLAVALVQCFDLLAGALQNGLVLFGFGRVCVGQIAEHGVDNFRVFIAEIIFFKRIEYRIDFITAAEQYGHHNDGAELASNALLEGHARQPPRW